MSRLEMAREQIIQARSYTLWLLDQVDPALWFWQPPGCVTHVAWQAAHLAMAEYRLALERIRGRRPEDEALLSADFLARFGRDSVPDPDPARNPTPAELRAMLTRVHERVLSELRDLPEEELDRSAGKPHRFFSTKLGALLWCSRHEMLHAGQIGLLRRLMGEAPLW